MSVLGRVLSYQCFIYGMKGKKGFRNGYGCVAKTLILLVPALENYTWLRKTMKSKAKKKIKKEKEDSDSSETIIYVRVTSQMRSDQH